MFMLEKNISNYLTNRLGTHEKVITNNWWHVVTDSCSSQLLLGLDGRHLSYPGVEMIAVEALRIVPNQGTNKGYLTVDGEVIPWTPIQSRVLHKRGRIMTR